ncbi:MAG: hypothetical protein AAGE92_00025 [Cyanobacteria bacterium P01_G01_bin.4]
MAKFMDYNPLNGVWTETDHSAHAEVMTISRKQDLEGLLEYTKASRNSGINDRVGEFSHYAIIPTTVQVELHKKGIDVGSPHQTKELMREINQNYPHLKMTNLTHDH